MSTVLETPVVNETALAIVKPNDTPMVTLVTATARKGSHNPSTGRQNGNHKGGSVRAIADMLKTSTNEPTELAELVDRVIALAKSDNLALQGAGDFGMVVHTFKKTWSAGQRLNFILKARDKNRLPKDDPDFNGLTDIGKLAYVLYLPVGWKVGQARGKAFEMTGNQIAAEKSMYYLERKFVEAEAKRIQAEKAKALEAKIIEAKQRVLDGTMTTAEYDGYMAQLGVGPDTTPADGKPATGKSETHKVNRSSFMAMWAHVSNFTADPEQQILLRRFLTASAKITTDSKVVDKWIKETSL